MTFVTQHNAFLLPGTYSTSGNENIEFLPHEGRSINAVNDLVGLTIFHPRLPNYLGGDADTDDSNNTLIGGGSNVPTISIDGGPASVLDEMTQVRLEVTYEGVSTRIWGVGLLLGNGRSLVLVDQWDGQALLSTAGSSDTLLNPSDFGSIRIVDWHPLQSWREYAQGNIGSSPFVCYAQETGLLTASGEVEAGRLEVGDQVWSLDNGSRPVRWIGTRHLGPEQLADRPNQRPIRIRRGALGKGLPRRDLLVSPQHRVLVSSKIARNRFGDGEALVPAKHLTALSGISVAEDIAEVTYVHILFDRHEVLIAEGAPAESLYLGPDTHKTLSPEQLLDIRLRFPETVLPDYRMVPARRFLTGPETRQLAQLHAARGRPLLEGLSPNERSVRSARATAFRRLVDVAPPSTPRPRTLGERRGPTHPSPDEVAFTRH